MFTIQLVNNNNVNNNNKCVRVDVCACGCVCVCSFLWSIKNHPLLLSYLLNSSFYCFLYIVDVITAGNNISSHFNKKNIFSALIKSLTFQWTKQTTKKKQTNIRKIYFLVRVNFRTCLSIKPEIGNQLIAIAKNLHLKVQSRRYQISWGGGGLRLCTQCNPLSVHNAVKRNWILSLPSTMVSKYTNAVRDQSCKLDCWPSKQ